MAQKTARGFTGSTRPDLNMAEASGVLEFTPVGLCFWFGWILIED